MGSCEEEQHTDKSESSTYSIPPCHCNEHKRTAAMKGRADLHQMSS